MAKRFWGILFILIIVIIGFNFKSIMKVFYPVQYEDVVVKYSKEYKLNQYLVYSLIRVESKFNPYAKSGKSAKGLMQITGQTGRYIAALVGDNDFKEEKLYDPETNIKYGCYYFSKLLRDFNGSLECAMAAYNGGEGNVRKWLDTDKYGNRFLDVEAIPYNETRQYVKRVTKYYDIYRFLYSDKNYDGIPNFLTIGSIYK